MDYREYRSRREGAGLKRFILVKYWEPNRMKVRELNKGPSAEKPIKELNYPVRDVDPTGPDKAVDAADDEGDWDWDDQITQMPISRSRARPQNREEMIRADTLRDKRQRELREIPDGTSAGVRVKSDVRFLKEVVAEFRLWFIDSGFELPSDISEENPELSGHKFARRLHKYLDLSDTPLDQVEHRHLSDVHEAASRDRPRKFIVGYSGLNKALKKAGFYSRDEDSNQSGPDKLTACLTRIKKYVESGERPE